MTNSDEKSLRDSKPAQAKYIRSKLLDGATYAELEDEGFSPGMLRKAAKGRGEFEGVDCEINPIEYKGGGDTPKWVETHSDTDNDIDVANTPAVEIVNKVRNALLNGETFQSLPYSDGTIHRAAKGKGRFEDIDADVPELEHTGDHTGGKWHTVGGDGTENTTPGRRALNKKQVKNIREAALEGLTSKEISKQYDASRTVIKSALAGRNAYENIDCEIEPLIFHTSSDQCWKRQSEVQKDETVNNAQTEADTQKEQTETTRDTTDTEPPTYHPPERDSNRRLAYGVALVALVSYVLGKLRGGD
jgi:hypothetical protein